MEKQMPLRSDLQCTATIRSTRTGEESRCPRQALVEGGKCGIHTGRCAMKAWETKRRAKGKTNGS
jgi:hypothetical protein